MPISTDSFDGQLKESARLPEPPMSNADRIYEAVMRLNEIDSHLNDLRSSIGLNVAEQNEAKKEPLSLVCLLEQLPQAIHEKVDKVHSIIHDIEQALRGY